MFSYSFEIWDGLLLVSGNNNPAPTRNQSICFHILLRSGTGYCSDICAVRLHIWMCVCASVCVRVCALRGFAKSAWCYCLVFAVFPLSHSRCDLSCYTRWTTVFHATNSEPQWRHDVIMGCLMLLRRCSHAVRANSHRPKSHNKIRQY